MINRTGATVWLTGLSGSGKTTVATALASILDAEGVNHFVLDGDILREGLNSDLGFSIDDRNENVRRVGEVACLFATAGFVAIVPVISPIRAGRDAVRATHERRGLRFVEVHMNASLEECERRDVKGLYQRARAGEIPEFTGIDSPYEPPLFPELVCGTDDGSPDELARTIRQML